MSAQSVELRSRSAWILWLAALSALVGWPLACRAPSAAGGGRLVLFHGGPIYPRAGAEPVEALLARDGRVVALGSLARLERRCPSQCRRVDLEGATALPGFQDAHGDLEELGAGLERLDLSRTIDPGRIWELVGKAADALPDGTWLVADGLDPLHWDRVELAPRVNLTRVAPANPVIVRSRDGSVAWANELALEFAGFRPDARIEAPGASNEVATIEAAGMPAVGLAPERARADSLGFDGSEEGGRSRAAIGSSNAARSFDGLGSRPAGESNEESESDVGGGSNSESGWNAAFGSNGALDSEEASPAEGAPADRASGTPLGTLSAGDGSTSREIATPLATTAPRDATDRPGLARDAAGRAIGRVSGEALAQLEAALPRATRVERLRRFLAGQSRLLEAGVTCVHDPTLDAESLALLSELAEAGRLRLRVAAYLDVERVDAATLARARSGRGPVRLVGGSLRLDGSLAARGAALLADYDDEPGARGVLRYSTDELIERLATLSEAGLQANLVAAGDRAVGQALVALRGLYAEHPSALAMRPRVDGSRLGLASQLSELRELGGVAVLQPALVEDGGGLWRRRLGRERRADLPLLRRLAASGFEPALGSGFPGGAASPLHTVQAWIVGAGSEWREAFWQAVRAHTEGAAAAALEERTRGRLEPGYACDISVIDVDPATADRAGIGRARVLMTVIDGEVVHRATPVPSGGER